jgi:ABC-type dipeptide/oligopeptide/nickel transport system permease component
MLKFIIRRVIWTIPVLLVVILMTFLMMRMIKGNPFQVTERAVPESIQRNLDRKFHLDQPWYMQYLYYVKGVFTWDLGPSLVQRNQTVNDVIRETFPVSLKLGGMAMLFAIVFGIPLGVIAALKQNTPIDYAAMAVVNAGYALPNFLIATLLIYFFAVKWRAETPFPTNGWAGWESWVLPVIALGHAPMTVLARITRGSMLETLQQDYIRTAKAKGLRWRRVVGLHVLRNSLIPAVTAAGPLLGYLITGAFIVETIFGIPGIGRYFITSVTGRDYSVALGITVLLSVIIILANLVVDTSTGTWTETRTPGPMITDRRSEFETLSRPAGAGRRPLRAVLLRDAVYRFAEPRRRRRRLRVRCSGRLWVSRF